MTAWEGLVSFVLPAYDERESLPRLLEEIRRTARRAGLRYEIVVVDDGSRDGSSEWLRKQAENEPDLVAVLFPFNRGQSTALAAGLLAARGERIVTLDADLQNDPGDALRLLAALDEDAADLATGVRGERRDALGKRLGSIVGNSVRRFWLRDSYRDVGCQLRAWRRPVAQGIPHFDGFHRFIPVLARDAGFEVTEREVHHRARAFGTTHYGNLGRALPGLRDLARVKWGRPRGIEIPDADVVGREDPEDPGAREDEAG